MDCLHESLEFRASYDDTTRLMNESLITVEKHCRELRDRIVEQRKSLADALRMNKDDAKRRKALHATMNFHDHIRDELVAIEEICHEYRAKLGAERASEIQQRFVQSMHTSFDAVKKSYDLCGNILVKPNGNEKQSMLQECLCEWTNVSSYNLENTLNIVYGPKRSMPSEFDESDEKFKQQLMVLRTKVFSFSSNKHEVTRSA